MYSHTTIRLFLDQVVKLLT